jgi:hypothetical protein
VFSAAANPKKIRAGVARDVPFLIDFAARMEISGRIKRPHIAYHNPKAGNREATPECGARSLRTLPRSSR